MAQAPSAARGPVAGTVVGIDIGGTGTRLVAVDPTTLAVTGRTTVATPTSGTPEEVQEFLAAQVEHVCHGRAPLAVGVGASGPIDPDGVVRNPDTLPVFTGLPLPTMIARLTDGPVVIDNDAVCAAIAEHAVGAARDSPRSLHVTLGTGVGVCLLQGSAPFRLHDGSHPEGGHVSVAVPAAPCYCGRRLCWEQAASRQALQRSAADVVGGSSTDRSVLPELSARAEQGDLAALAAYDRYGEAVADGLATLLALYGPVTVVLGGSGSQHLHHYRHALTRSLAALEGWVPEHSIVATHLDDHGGAIGGAHLAASALARSHEEARVQDDG